MQHATHQQSAQIFLNFSNVYIFFIKKITSYCVFFQNSLNFLVNLVFFLYKCHIHLLIRPRYDPWFSSVANRIVACWLWERS